MDFPITDPSSSTSKMDVDIISEKDLTNKFLSGEMSFADYSNEWYNVDDEENDEDNDEDNDDLGQSDEELRQSPTAQILKKGPFRRRRTARLSPALVGLMGEANLRFVRGDIEMAVKMCHEVIKHIPRAPEPYQTLAQIYEKDEEKSLQFSLLAAHLSPSDANEWLRLAAISKQRNDIRQEMMCYTQAIRADPKNLDTHLKRIDVLKRYEEAGYSMQNVSISCVRCYHKIVTSLPASEGETILKYAKLAATMYHNNNEIDRTLEVMLAAYKKCSSLFTLEDINILLELFIAKKQYQACLDIFVAHSGVEIEAEIQTVKNSDNEIEEQTNYISCTIPQNLPIDLRSKLLVCFIHLGSMNLVQTLLHEFLLNDVEKAGDLYMDIEEALSSVGYHELAMKLLDPLVKNNSFDLGAVWLKHAECLYNLGREGDAIESYYKVLKHVPQHPDARRKLSSILESRRKIDDALNILQQDYKYVVSARLLHEQCSLLKKYNKELEYLEVGEALLSKSFPRYRHQEELKMAFKMKAGVDLIHNFREMRGENPFHENDIHFDEEETFKLSPQEEWHFFNELLGIARRHNKYFAMQRLTFGAVMSKGLSAHRVEIEFLCLQACLLSNDFQNALRFTRDFAQKHPKPKTWNLLNFVMNALDEPAQIKFLSRLFQKDNKIVKNLFLGNNFLTSGRYLVALKYFLEYNEQCRDSLSAMLVGVTSLLMAAQRTVDKHHNLILQGIHYLFQYHKLRKCDQEGFYNIARAYHMLSINNLAVEYYERAMKCEPIAKCDKHGSINLTKEIAFNLYLLYKGHSPQMAHKYMTTYLVIE